MKRLLGCAVVAFVLVAQHASADTIFFDDFNRSNGALGNGWVGGGSINSNSMLLSGNRTSTATEGTLTLSTVGFTSLHIFLTIGVRRAVKLPTHSPRFGVQTAGQRSTYWERTHSTTTCRHRRKFQPPCGRSKSRRHNARLPVPRRYGKRRRSRGQRPPAGSGRRSRPHRRRWVAGPSVCGGGLLAWARRKRKSTLKAG